jgi:hypothetical protein
MFDSFECAIHALAPVCAACGIRILGHGLEKAGAFYCCNHCAEAKGAAIYAIEPDGHHRPNGQVSGAPGLACSGPSGTTALVWSSHIQASNCCGSEAAA